MAERKTGFAGCERSMAIKMKKRIPDRKRIRENLCFILLFIAAVFAVIMRNQRGTAPIVSIPDSQIAFSTENEVLEQTWQPYVRKIAGVSVPYVSASDFESSVELRIYSDDYAELLSQTEIRQAFRKDEEGTLKFEFDTVKVMPGERYRMQLRYVEPLGEGTLRIKSGSNYGGCSIDGGACNEAAAFDIAFYKNSRIFWAFLVFFPFLSFSLLFMTVWNRKWEECIGLSMIIAAAVLYVTGLMEHLMAGMALLYIFAVISFFLAVYFYHKKKMRIKDLLSPSLLIYAVLFLVILLKCHDMRFAKVDEYSQWGMAVKDMFYYQSLAKHIHTTVFIPRYPPFSALIEYFFVFHNGLFTPELVYVGFQTMLLSASMILCAAVGNKWRYLLPSAAVMIAMPAIFFVDAYNCVIVDPLLAVFTAYVLICYFTEELSGFNLLRILGGLFALTLTKDIGVVIAGLLTIIMVTDRLCRPGKSVRKSLKAAILPCLCAVFVLSVFLSWQIYMSIPAKEALTGGYNLQGTAEDAETGETALSGEAADVSGTTAFGTDEDSGATASEAVVNGGAAVGTEAGADTEAAAGTEAGTDAEASAPQEEIANEVSFQGTFSASGISLDGILGLFRHEDGGYRYQTIKNFLLEIFDGDTYELGSINVSYVDIFLLMLISIGIFGYFRYWGEHFWEMTSFGIYTFLAGMGYSMVLLLIFLFAFPQTEALLLIGHERYLASFLGGVVSAWAVLILRRAAEREEKHKSHSLTVAFCLTACIAICTPVRHFIVKNEDYKIMDDQVYGYDTIAEILRSFSRKTENIYFVCNGKAGDSYWVFRNTVSPLRNSHTQYNIYASEEAYQEQKDIWTRNGEEIQGTAQIVSCETWAEELRDYQYVFIFHPGEVFGKSYAELFAEPDTIEDGTFYRVNSTDGNIALEYIGKTDVKSFK